MRMVRAAHKGETQIARLYFPPHMAIASRPRPLITYTSSPA